MVVREILDGFWSQRFKVALMKPTRLASCTVIRTLLPCGALLVSFQKANKAANFFLSARAGGILSIIQSDWFRQRTQFFDPACEPGRICSTFISRVLHFMLNTVGKLMQHFCSHLRRKEMLDDVEDDV